MSTSRTKERVKALVTRFLSVTDHCSYCNGLEFRDSAALLAVSVMGAGRDPIQPERWFAWFRAALIVASTIPSALAILCAWLAER